MIDQRERGCRGREAGIGARVERADGTRPPAALRLGCLVNGAWSEIHAFRTVIQGPHNEEFTRREVVDVERQVIKILRFAWLYRC
jgi:hypothetical protein